MQSTKNQKKSQKKHGQKQAQPSPLLHHSSASTTCPSIKPSPLLTLNMITRKYILKQINNQRSENIRRMILNKNKATTQLRLYCSQKQHLSRFYNNPTAIIKLRSNNQHKSFKNTNGLHCYIWINLDDKLNTLFKIYKKQKIAHYNKTGKIQEKQRPSHHYIKSPFSPSPTPPLDDSEFCLKTLVTKIQNMIKFDYELGSGAFLPKRGFMTNRISADTSNIMVDFFKEDHTNTDEDSNKKSQVGNFVTVDSIFGQEGRKISEISCTKDLSNIEPKPPTRTGKYISEFESDYREEKVEGMQKYVKKDLRKEKKISNHNKQQKKGTTDLYKLQSTEPVCFKSNNINDEYGIIRHPPPENMFRRKNHHKNSKKKSSLENSNSANKLSSSPLSSKSKKKKQSTSNKKTNSTKVKECPYQNPNDQKNRKKQGGKHSSTKRYHVNK